MQGSIVLWPIFHWEHLLQVTITPFSIGVNKTIFRLRNYYNLSDLEEICSLNWIFQQALNKCDESGLCRFHLCIAVLPQIRLMLLLLLLRLLCLPSCFQKCVPSMYLHLYLQKLSVVFPNSSGSLENQQNPELSLYKAPESAETSTNCYCKMVKG